MATQEQKVRGSSHGFCWYAAISLNFKMKLGPVWTNSMVGLAHSLLFIWLPSVLSTRLARSVYFLLDCTSQDTGQIDRWLSIQLFSAFSFFPNCLVIFVMEKGHEGRLLWVVPMHMNLRFLLLVSANTLLHLMFRKPPVYYGQAPTSTQSWE